MFRLTSFVVFVSLAACGGKSASKTTTSSSASTGGDPQATCVASFQRSRTCTDDFIPALVDARAKLNAPPGIADKVKADRDGVIAAAKTEWAEDSKDEHITKQCGDMIAHGMGADMDGAKECLAKADCAGFVTCIMPTVEKHLTAPHP
jgi:hypothetical protein